MKSLAKEQKKYIQILIYFCLFYQDFTVWFQRQLQKGSQPTPDTRQVTSL